MTVTADWGDPRGTNKTEAAQSELTALSAAQTFHGKRVQRNVVRSFVFILSNWNMLEYFKPEIGTINLCLKGITNADVWATESRGYRWKSRNQLCDYGQN